MQIGDIIRKHRKEKNITQETMANRLGVTAPAVNKWENGNSFPDITLLSPIARLLNISVDTLLSHEKELSDVEANRMVEDALERLKNQPFDTVFQWMKQCLEAYPSSNYLILWMARIFDSQRQMIELPDGEQYDAYIIGCYERVLESDNESLKPAAAEAIFYFYVRKKQYERAEKYLVYFSKENPERKRKQAMICSETGRQAQAHKMYEELLYTGYQSLSRTFHDIYILALKANNLNKAHKLIEKIQQLAHLFEFGEYHEISPALELATLEKDEAETLRIMERMLVNLESIYAFTQSSLYAHMEFKAPSEDDLTKLRQELIKGFQDEESYGYLKGNQQWRNLIGI